MTWGEEGYKKLEEVTRALKGMTGGHKGLEKVTRGDTGLQGLQTVTTGYKG